MSIYDLCIVVHSLSFFVFFLFRLFFMYWLLVYVALGATSIVEPHGFSGSLPVMIFLCVVNSVSLFRRIKMFCSVQSSIDLFPSNHTNRGGIGLCVALPGTLKRCGYCSNPVSVDSLGFHAVAIKRTRAAASKRTPATRKNTGRTKFSEQVCEQCDCNSQHSAYMLCLQAARRIGPA